MSETEKVVENSGFSLSELIQSPINLCLLFVIVYFLYKIFKLRKNEPEFLPEPKLPKMKNRDFTVEELKKYDGTQEDGRVLIAVNGNVYDVTKGKHFYGPGGPYGAFAGRDASRGLATFALDAVVDGYDDLSDLSATELNEVKEWESQFQMKYDFVGRLLKPGEQPRNYSDEDSVAEEKNKND